MNPFLRRVRFLFGVLLTLNAHLAFGSSNGLVISQIYGGGGSTSTAPTPAYKLDWIELFNGGSAPVNLSGLSLQYGSATGNFGAGIANLPSLSLQPGQYFLVAAAATGGALTGADLPVAPDLAGQSLNLSATAGKLVLVTGTTSLACGAAATPCDATQSARIVDLVGYGSTANRFEGSAPTATLSSVLSALRAVQGCTDSDNNGTDFAASPSPVPRNSAAALNVCGTSSNAPIVTNCPAVTFAAGSPGSVVVSASDVDGVVNAVSVTTSLPAGFSLGAFAPAPGTAGTATQAVGVAASVPVGSYSVGLQWSNNQAQVASCTLNVAVTGLSSIASIQGSGSSSPRLGQSVTTEGVVTKLLNNGFFMQDLSGDGDPATSDGIFVFTSTAPTVGVGQLIRLSGTVAEFNTGASTNAETASHTVTEITSPTAITLLGAGYSIVPVTVVLPESFTDELERFEGMLVTLQGPLTVSQNYFLGRYGQLTLSAGGRLEVPTNRWRPGPDAQALFDANARASIVLDDGTSVQNPNPTPYIANDNTVRAGDTIASITGVIDYGLATASNTGLADYKIHPTQTVAIARANPRTTTPPNVGGNVRVASANVLNFFTTFTNGTTAAGGAGQGCSLGGAVAAANCRGADNLAEFIRQRTKLVEEIAALDADVVGLMEIQNNGATAVQNLVDALNARVGSGTYARVPDPVSGTGTDAIKVAMIYKPGKLTRVGDSLSDADAIHNRPPLAQAFAAPNGERFYVVVNHFKSKGCDGAAGADLDVGDLQGCFNNRRTLQAQALRSFLPTVQAAAGTGDGLLIGDFNAYAQEDPIFDFTSRGYVDEVGRYNSFGYSYVFDGAAGRLDQAISTPTLSAKVAGATEWHVNADEPFVIDYNTEFKQPACPTCGPDYFTPTPYRSSDHDPVLVGLNLVKTLNGTAGRDTIVGTPGDDVIDGGEGADTLTGGAGRDVFVYQSMRDAGDAITDFTPGTDRIDLRALLASIGVDPAAAVASGVVQLLASGANTLLRIDTDGSAGPATPRVLVTLRNVSASSIDVARDLILQ